ncbi:MAG: hypothetical protein AB1758_02095, partial [Candidatus Eremiobacterota bacterium]
MASRKVSRRETPSLVGRQWLFDQVEAWMAAPDSWSAVLVAHPGVGKSAFLRELASRHPESILVDIRRPLGSHRPRGFWAALLAQVDLQGKRVPESPHEASRWAAEHLPLGGKQPRLVVVDSLDHSEGLLDASGLAGLDQPLPGVRLLLATRPSEDVAGLERSGARVFRLAQDDPRNLADVESFLGHRLQQAGRSLTALDRLVRLAAGNFVVARFVADASAERLLDHVDLKAELEIPALDRALWAVWEEVVGLAPPDLHEDMARVACSLCEAGEPLPAASLADFLGLTASRVNQVLRWLRPLLAEAQNRFRLFHPALSSLVARRFQRDLVQVHRGVVSFFREAFPSWEEMNDHYGWMWLGHHCDRLARTARRRDFSVLHWLGEGPFLRAKLTQTRSLKAVLDDLLRCLRAALEELDLPRIVHYGLQLPRLRAQEAASGLHEMADLGELDLARERARLLKDERTRFLGFLLLAWQAHDESKPALVDELLDEVLQIPRPSVWEDDQPLLLCIVADLAGHDVERAFRLLDREEDPMKAASYGLRLAQSEGVEAGLRRKALERALEWTARIEDEEERQQARRSLARQKELLSSNGRPSDLPGRDLAPIEKVLAGLSGSSEPLEAFAEALEKVGQIRWETRRVLAISAAASTLAHLADRDWVLEAFCQLLQIVVQLQSAEERLKAVGRVARSMATAGRRPFTGELAERIAAVAETLEDLPLRSRAQATLGLCLHVVRDFRNSNARLSEAASLAFKIEDREQRARTLAFVAGSVAETGDNVRARDLAFHALQAFEEPPAERHDQNTRCSLIVGLVSSGHEYSAHALQQAAQAVTHTVEPRARATSLIAVARGMYRMGEIDWARKLFEQ